jgi:anaerobic carbon-monoxide dehydrogenase iron sulfur subunit
MKRLFIRPELCTGCKTCELACAVAHSSSQNLLGAMTESPPPHTRIYVEAAPVSPFEILKMPMTCRHCDPAPCIAACIPQAMHRGSRDEVTNVGGKHACIACAMCIMTCPFGMIGRAAVLDEIASAGYRVMAVKCDLCPDRPAPACVTACPTGAILFVEGDEFAHGARQRASSVLALARQVREATLVQAQQE